MNAIVPLVGRMLFGVKLFLIFATKVPGKGQPLSSLARTTIWPARMMSITSLKFVGTTI